MTEEDREVLRTIKHFYGIGLGTLGMPITTDDEKLFKYVENKLEENQKLKMKIMWLEDILGPKEASESED